ncbi:helix-turn-helix transcriptional regulator [Micromonospora sonneratiae]
MSQQVFADRLGKSKSWVDKVERGVRRLDKFSVLHEIADVLRVDVQLLLGKEPERRTDALNCIDQVEVEAIRSALERYESMPAFFVPAPDPPALDEVRKSVRHAWLTLQYARYGVLTRALPKLLRDTQAADAAYRGGDERAQEAAHLLGQVYQIASSTLRKLGEHELAWLAADRSMAVSQRSGDLLLTGVATCRVGNALLALGRPKSALEVNVNVASQLAPNGCRAASAQQLSVYGLLLLQGAMAAARIGDNATVRELFVAAQEAADQLGGDYNHYWTSFGPTNLSLHQAAAAVELGEGGRAVRTDQEIDPDRFNALLPERRAHHLLDLARGFAQIGNMEQAGESLLRGDQLAPSEIRCRPIAHEVMSDVLRRTRGAPSSPIVELAEHMGVGI